MLRRDQVLYEFGSFRLSVTERLLTRGGIPVPLPTKIFDTLLLLVENKGRLMEKDELLSSLWPDTIVEEASLTRNISHLRKALNDSKNGERYIETVPKRGYRFIAEVKGPLSESGESLTRPLPETATLIGEETAAAQLKNELSSAEEEKQPEPARVFNFNGPRGSNSEPLSPPPPPSFLHSTPKQSVASKVKRAASLALMLLVIVTAGFWLSRNFSRRGDAAEIRVTKLTQTGQTTLPAISSDGKYVAYVQDKDGQQSVWVRQVASGSVTQVIAPANIRYQGLTLSPEDNYIYYVVYEQGQLVGTLHRVSILGGVTQKVIQDVDSPVTFSPDGRQLAFVRNDPAQGETSLVIANADGSDQRKLSTRVRPNLFSLSGPAWSPDGKVIVSGVRNTCPAGHFDLVAVDVKDGSEKIMTSQQPGQQWISIRQVAWLKDGRGILAVAWHEGAVIFSDQIWYFPWPSGEPRRITNDSNTYAHVSVAADGRTLVASQFTRLSSIEVSASGKTDRAEKISSGMVGNATITQGLCWTPDGRIVYSSEANGRSDLWMMNADGSERKQLTDDDAADFKPAMSPDGRYLAFTSYRHNGRAQIWLMNSDGSNLKCMTDGSDETDPSFSPDGQWIVYSSVTDGTPKLWKTPTHGGPPVQLTGFYSLRPAISPDGKWLAFFYYDEPSRRLKIGLIPFGNGKTTAVSAPTRVFEDLIGFSSPILCWSADSQALIYSQLDEGVINLWSRRLNSAPPQKLTSFKEDRLFSFDLSRDGKRFVYERGHVLSDLVLMSNFDPAH